VKQPEISVVIPAYNEEKQLPLCLGSLTKQRCVFPYEIIVVDNASTDRTAEIAEEFGVRVIHEPRKGVSAARQAGFEAARAEIIASTDADCIVPSDWLSRIRDIFDENPRLAAVGGYVLFHDAPLYFNILPKFTHRLNAFRIAGQLVGRQPLSTQNLAVRKEAFTKAG